MKVESSRMSSQADELSIHDWQLFNDNFTVKELPLYHHGRWINKLIILMKPHLYLLFETIKNSIWRLISELWIKCNFASIASKYILSSWNIKRSIFCNEIYTNDSRRNSSKEKETIISRIIVFGKIVIKRLIELRESKETKGLEASGTLSIQLFRKSRGRSCKDYSKLFVHFYLKNCSFYSKFSCIWQLSALLYLLKNCTISLRIVCHFLNFAITLHCYSLTFVVKKNNILF